MWSQVLREMDLFWSYSRLWDPTARLKMQGKRQRKSRIGPVIHSEVASKCPGDSQNQSQFGTRSAFLSLYPGWNFINPVMILQILILELLKGKGRCSGQINLKKKATVYWNSQEIIIDMNILEICRNSATKKHIQLCLSKHFPNLYPLTFPWNIIWDQCSRRHLEIEATWSTMS